MSKKIEKDAEVARFFRDQGIPIQSPGVAAAIAQWWISRAGRQHVRPAAESCHPAPPSAEPVEERAVEPETAAAAAPPDPSRSIFFPSARKRDAGTANWTGPARTQLPALQESTLVDPSLLIGVLDEAPHHEAAPVEGAEATPDVAQEHGIIAPLDAGDAAPTVRDDEAAGVAASTDVRPRAALSRRRKALIMAATPFAALITANVSEPLVAMVHGGSQESYDELRRGQSVLVFGPGRKPTLARPMDADHSAPTHAHFNQQDMDSENFRDAAIIVANLEDRSLRAAPLSWKGLLRVNGTDLVGISRAVVGAVTGQGGGGSTAAVQLCSLKLGTETMNKGLILNLRDKVREHLCAIRLEAEMDGDLMREAGMLIDVAPLVVGGSGSGFGPEVRGAVATSHLLFNGSFRAVKKCEVAFLAASINRPFRVAGPSEASRASAQRVFEASLKRAQHGLMTLRMEQGGTLTAEDKACFARLPRLLQRSYRNPKDGLRLAFGDASEQVRSEAFAALATSRDGGDIRAGFDAMANEAAMARVARAACTIKRRTHLLRNICPDDGPLRKVQIRVHAMERDGLLYRSVSLGAGSSRSVNEAEDGSLPSRGSVNKGLLIPVLNDDDFCRFDFPGLADADGEKGLDHPCRPGESLDPAFAFQRSLNQPLVYAAEHADQAALANFTRALGLPPTVSARDLVLGKNPPSTQTLMRDYAAITSRSRIGYRPHFIRGAPSDPVDLRKVMSIADVDRVRNLLGAPTRAGGTVHAMTVKLAKAGYHVNLAKSGTSESGRGSDERGKHVIAEVVDPAGRVLIVFAEIASSDAGALSRSHELGSGDLGEIILAALES